jgi:ribosomal protein L3 glutamine methyltransferase
MTKILKTPRDLLRYAVSRFNEARVVHGHGTLSVIDEAAFIILESLHLPVHDINPWLDAALLENERDKILTLVDQRIATRKPAAYLLNRIYMQGLPFFIDERAIIPRSYIGELLEKGVLGADGAPLLPDPESIETVLDLCTGSGCLAILAANYFPDAQIDATDISAEALEVAKINLQQHHLQDRIKLHKGDLFSALKDRRYDLIIANPPYVAKAKVEAFPPEYAHEPKLAHLGGEDGLDIVRKIITQASAHLAPGGNLICEIGLGREIIDEEFAGANLVWLDTEESEGEVFLLSAQAQPTF